MIEALKRAIHRLPSRGVEYRTTAHQKTFQLLQKVITQRPTANMSQNTSESANKISVCLWLNDQADEAAKFYTNLFLGSPRAKDAGETGVFNGSRYEADVPQPCQDFEPGKTLTKLIKLAGQEIMLLNGGPMFKLSPAISLMVDCADQEEVDYFWEGFSEGDASREMNCGWVNDRYGVSWQVVPHYVRELHQKESDREKAKRMQVWMMKELPKKFVIKDMKAAAEGTNA